MTITYQHRCYVVTTEAELASFVRWMQTQEAA